ncbi:hypothetical protein D3C76_567870 [compost metagenome]
MNQPRDILGSERSAHLWRELEARPYAHDLFHLLRKIDALSANAPLGTATRPREEPLRIGQEPSMTFAPGEIFEARASGERPSLSILGFGLFRPNGPMPLHLTEYVRERKSHHKDNTFSAFADLFHHRLTLLFYRAWAQAQAVVSLDRGEERFAHYLACLMQTAGESMRRRNTLADHARLAMAGHLLRQTRNAEGLVQILRGYFGVPVAVQENVETWVELHECNRARIARHGSRLGAGHLLGTAMREAQSRFRLVLGPMPWSRYRDFLPGAAASRQLRDWVRQYVGFEFAWDVRLVLQRDAVPGTRLGGHSRMGYGTWLGRRQAPDDAGELLYDPERYWRTEDSTAHSLESSE